ncbi:hypothetical protein V4B17_05335 [Bartonella sp. B23]
MMEEWKVKCGFTETSKNYENMRLTGTELEKKRQAEVAEHNRKLYGEFKAKIEAKLEKIETDTSRLRAMTRSKTAR